MNKKKIIVLISSVLIIGAVGGSFAWFTSQDSLTNHFTTAGVPSNNPEDGVKVIEIVNGKILMVMEYMKMMQQRILHQEQKLIKMYG